LLPLHAQARLVGQSSGVVLQHSSASVPAPRQLSLHRGTAGGGGGVHHRVESRPSPPVPLDFYRLPVASWPRHGPCSSRVKGPSRWRRVSPLVPPPPRPRRRPCCSRLSRPSGTTDTCPCAPGAGT